MAIKDIEARQTFNDCWAELERKKPYYGSHEFFKSQGWFIISSYWHDFNKHITRARRDKMIKWILEEVGRMSEVPIERWKETLKELRVRACKEA